MRNVNKSIEVTHYLSSFQQAMANGQFLQTVQGQTWDPILALYKIKMMGVATKYCNLVHTTSELAIQSSFHLGAAKENKTASVSNNSYF